MLPNIVSDQAITVAFPDGSLTIKNGLSNGDQFDAVRQAVKAGDFDLAKQLMSPGKWIAKQFENFEPTEDGHVELVNEIVYYNGQPTKSYITDRIITMSREGFGVDPMLKFLKKLFMNPSESAREELYQFLEYAHIPITEDGDVLCFKKVRSDYKDLYTGTMDNTPGRIVEIDRGVVDTNRHNTCSTGLHVCAPSYLPEYHRGVGRVIKVLVNPADFVSIPVDYNFAKARVAKYYVLGDVGDAREGEHLAAAEKKKSVQHSYDVTIQPADDPREPVVFRVEKLFEIAVGDDNGPLKRNSAEAVDEANMLASMLAKLYAVDKSSTMTALELYQEIIDSDTDDTKKAAGWMKARRAIIEKLMPNFFVVVTVPGKASTFRFSGEVL